jgi:hypothetical protein
MQSAPKNSLDLSALSSASFSPLACFNAQFRNETNPGAVESET